MAATRDVHAQVLPEVDELQRRADGVALRQRLCIVHTVEVQQQAAYGVGRAPAIVQQFRAVEALPGIEINEVSGANYGRAQVEWTLPPLRFRRVGVPSMYLRFAQSPEALWAGNFRDLSASVTRLATLAEGGRIDTTLVEAELQRLRWHWQHAGGAASSEAAIELEALLGSETVESLDLFDRLQLESVLRICRESKTLSDAGRKLFHRSRTQRSVVNDADRLRKYLQKYGLTWDAISA